MKERAPGVATLISVIAIFIAASLASFPAPSECGSLEIHGLRALLPFLLFATAGGYVMRYGAPAHRLVVFFAAAVSMVGYVAMLSLTLPMALGMTC